MDARRAKQLELMKRGYLYSRQWLRQNGVAEHYLDNQLKNGSIKSIVPGIYTLGGSHLTWQGVVASLPLLLGNPIYVGGITSLKLQGFAHYVNFTSMEKIYLFSPIAMPVWLEKVFNLIPDIEYRWIRTARLWHNSWPDQPYMTDIHQDHEVVFSVSMPEQAILELLSGVPDPISFDTAVNIFDGLTQLSPARIDHLLKECKSIKAKRLFFWLADRNQYAWRARLKLIDYDLGSGKRLLAKGGKLDIKYQITVPQEFSIN